MSVIFKNNATSTLSQAIDDNQTLLHVQPHEAEEFPQPGGGQWFPLTLVDRAGNLEIVHCNSRTDNALSVERGREGTLARAYAEHSIASHRLTAESLLALTTQGVTISDVPPQPPLRNGQLWWESDSGALFVWYDDGDSAQWVQVGGGGGGGTGGSAVYTGDTAPSSPLHNGQLWWNSSTGNLYVWYDDIDSSQWVQINSAVSGGGGGDGGGGVLTIAAATAMTFLPSTLVIETQSYSTVPIRGGARYKRLSKVAIDAAAYPASSYFRSLDRYLPDGSVDATNGGYWLLHETRPSPHMLGGIGDGVADDVAAIQAALDYLFANGEMGGEVDLAGGRWLVDSDDLEMRFGTMLSGNWRAGANMAVAGTGNHSTDRGCIVLNELRTIKMWEQRSSLKGLTILRKGILNPTTLRMSIEQEQAMAGIGVTLGDPANPTLGLGGGCYIGHCFFIGFDTAVLGNGCGQSIIEYVEGDCRNGIHLNHSYDWQHMDHCHFWPWLLGGNVWRSYTITGAANNGSGLVRLTLAAFPPDGDPTVLITGDTINVRDVLGTTEVNEKRWVITVIDDTHWDLQGSTFTNAYVSGGIANISPFRHLGGVAYRFGTNVDGGQAQNCNAYGYDIGFDLGNVAFNSLINIGIDYHALAQDYVPIGIRVLATDHHARNAQLIGCRVTGVATGVLIDVPSGAVDPLHATYAMVQNLSSTGCRKYGIRVVRGYALITDCAIEVTHTGIMVEPTADAVQVVGCHIDLVNTSINIDPAVLRNCVVVGNFFTNESVGERKLIGSYNNQHIAEYSNGALGAAHYYQKGRGTSRVPLAALSADVALQLRAQFWDGVSQFRTAGGYRIQALGNTSATSSGGAHYWSTVANGTTTLEDTLWLHNGGLHPVVDMGIHLGGTATRWNAVWSQSFNLIDGVTAPSTTAGHAKIYIDVADGDLKIKFGDGTVKTIVVDT